MPNEGQASSFSISPDYIHWACIYEKPGVAWPDGGGACASFCVNATEASHGTVLHFNCHNINVIPPGYVGAGNPSPPYATYCHFSWMHADHTFSGTDVTACGSPPTCHDPYVLSGFNSDQCAYTAPKQPPCPDASGGPNTPKPVGTVGNPICPQTGNKLQIEVDYQGLGSNSLSFARYYNSLPLYSLADGKHWRHTYSRSIRTVMRVMVNGSNGAGAIAFRPDGHGVIFRSQQGQWVADADVVERLQQMVDGVGNVTGWRYVAADDQVETYDAAGRLSSIATRDGSSQTLAYDARGRLSSVTDTYGRQLGFSYDAIDNLVGMTDASGGFYRYDYDVGNRFVSVTYPDDKVRRYVYNEPAYVAAGCSLKPLTGIIDENSNRYAAFFYDTACRAVSTLHYSAPGQPVEQYTVNYLNLGVSSIVSDPMGTQRSFGFSTVLDVIKGASVSQPCSTVGCTGTVSNAAAYDANGNLLRTADFNNKIVCYAYDNARNLETARVEGILPAETCPAVLANPPNRPDVRKTVTTWNATWRLPATITEPAAGGSKTTTFTYDGSGNLTQRRITAPKNDGTGGTTTRIWSWTYATLGRVLTATDPNGNVTTTGYYADNDADFGKRGNVATITNPLGYVTQIAAYDANARPLTTLDPNGLSTTLAYDARGRLTGRNVGGESTRYGYDGVGQLALVTLPDGSSLAYTYDGAHRLTQIRDGLGNKIVYTLDAMGNRIQEQAFDPSNTLARTRSRTFDSLNRLARDIGAASQTTGYAYDNNGNLVRATDPLGRVTTNTYDSLNRLKQVLDPANGSTRYDYDPSGNLITVTDPRNLATGYIYDGLGGVIRQVSPDTGTTTSTYDAAGNLQTRLDARGVTATYAYDALNRVTQIVYTKTGSSSETHTFEYDGGASGASDAKGRLTRLTDGVATTTWSYTAQGRVAGKTQAVGGRAMSVTYDYNAAGQLAELTTPSGKVLDYTYVNNRIASIALDGAPLVSGVVATPFGSIGAWQWGNGLYTFRRFDGDGRLTSWEFRNGGSVLRNNLTYNTASRVIGVSDPAQSALAQSYSYDALDRLTGTQSGNPVAHSQQFGYDAVGNRVNQTVDGNGTNYGYGATSNRLQALSGATTRSYTYDGAGNPSAIDARTYAYNLANRLTQVQSGATTALYGVNALGQRVSKTLGGATPAVFLYDEQGHLLSEYYSPGELDGTFQETVWLEDLPVATFAPMLQMGPPTGAGDPPPVTVDLHYVHADHLGTPRAVTRPSDNSVVWRWDNVDPFGANAATDGQGSFRFNLRFPGQYYDAETGTHYNSFRDYDPIIGRYEQSDPIGIAGGINTYAYVKAPTSESDNLGLMGRAPGGGKPVPRSPRPSTGCGPGYGQGIPDNPLIIFHFRKCCDIHDRCYDDCERQPTKFQCDNSFCDCLTETCADSIYGDACRFLANTYCVFAEQGGKLSRQCRTCVPPYSPPPFMGW